MVLWPTATPTPVFLNAAPFLTPRQTSCSSNERKKLNIGQNQNWKKKKKALHTKKKDYKKWFFSDAWFSATSKFQRQQHKHVLTNRRRRTGRGKQLINPLYIYNNGCRQVSLKCLVLSNWEHGDTVTNTMMTDNSQVVHTYLLNNLSSAIFSPSNHELTHLVVVVQWD